MKKGIAALPLVLASLVACSSTAVHSSASPAQSAQSPSAQTSSSPPVPAFCPQPIPLDPGPDAATAASTAAQAAVPRLYPQPRVDSTGFSVTRVYAADASAQGYGMIPFGLCGTQVGQRTWVVELHFPRMQAKGADLANGQLFLSRFPDGWRVWYQYH